MKKAFIFFGILCLFLPCFSQERWTVSNSPTFQTRVDDIFMVNTDIGYAVCGDGKIVKTTDGGNNWLLLLQNGNVYCRSVEFMDAQKGFVGGFKTGTVTENILRETTDGGNSWTDLTSLIDPRAYGGICGLAIPDNRTIYGCGNWFGDAGYIVKSTDGGDSWSFIDMSAYATSIIDMYFINKDTGFVTGKGLAPLQTAIILYTTNGGVSWDFKYQHHEVNEYCWKIQRLTNKIFFASVESNLPGPPAVILKSTDGGMSWDSHTVSTNSYNLEGIGFINEKQGWTGGGGDFSFKTEDGGITWDTVHFCSEMNRVFRVNDTLLFATGTEIWKYRGNGIIPVNPDTTHNAWLHCYPNPANEYLDIAVYLKIRTRLLVTIYDSKGSRVADLENADKDAGTYYYKFNTSKISPGMYTVFLKTHDDKRTKQVIVVH